MARFELDGEVQGFSTGDLAKLHTAADILRLSVSEMADWVQQAATISAVVEAPLSEGEHAFLAASSGLVDDADTAHLETPAQQQARLLRSSLTTKEAADRLGVGPDAIRHRLGKKRLWSFVIEGQHRIPTWQFVSTNDPSYRGPRGTRTSDALSAIDDLLPRASFERSEPNEPFALTWGDIVDKGPYFVRISVRDADGNVLREMEDSPLIADAWDTLDGLEQVVPAIPDGTTPVALEGFMTTPQDELLVGGRPWAPRRWLAEGQDPAPVTRLIADLGTVW
ncbi:hypothetical protein ABRP24_001275 [Curtobacterium sp. WHRI 8282]|uniref:hypothetical protein n=1 Tax=Curtobacterium sp. WHRI 8282 TaxID=3162559 RepID=UPI0032F03AD6